MTSSQSLDASSRNRFQPIDEYSRLADHLRNLDVPFSNTATILLLHAHPTPKMLKNFSLPSAELASPESCKDWLYPNVWEISKLLIYLTWNSPHNICFHGEIRAIYPQNWKDTLSASLDSWLSWMPIQQVIRRFGFDPAESATFFHGDWSWSICYGHSLPSPESRRAVISFWQKNVHITG